MAQVDSAPVGVSHGANGRWARRRCFDSPESAKLVKIQKGPGHGLCRANHNMLHIDYSLIPLSDEDQDAIDLVVARRLEKGEIPHIDKSHHGRLVVLNPDAVQTIHHVPDELRTPLRRTLHSTAEGAIPTPAKKLFRDITDAEDTVHLLIIELESRFVHFQDFLDYIPRLRAQYPDLAIYIVGRIGQLIEKFQESLRSGGATLSLNYPDARGKIEITDPNELDQIVSENQEPPYFSFPSFPQLIISMS